MAGAIDVADSAAAVEVVGDNLGFKINCKRKMIIEDNTITKLPFRFGVCSQFRLAADKLETLAGAPEQCNLFAVEFSKTGRNNNLDSIANGPLRATHLAYQLSHPLRSLETGSIGPIGSLWVDAPSIISFEGLNVPVTELTLRLPLQQSLTGIHKQLKHIEEISIVLSPKFEGGLLSVAMIKGLKRINRTTNSQIGIAPTYEKVFMLINEALAQGLNIHELQEKMIEVGLGKFARL
ncbi:MAG: hypothetical protein KGI25_08120 [Thaumarchaeota archaeon]|nr:hypothetical protein [Nitrososphaerota archaeon]